MPRLFYRARSKIQNSDFVFCPSEAKRVNTPLLAAVSIMVSTLLIPHSLLRGAFILLNEYHPDLRNRSPDQRS